MRRCPIVLAAVVAAACAAKDAAPVDSTTAPAAASAPAASAPAASAPAADRKADEDSIRALHDRITSAMNGRDTAAVAALYTEDGVDFTPNTPPAKGRADLVKEYAGLFQSLRDLKMSMARADVMVAQSGELAVSRASYDMAWTDAKGKPGKDHGNVVIAWKKVNGAWKAITSMNASDQPMPGM